jgi:esterase/lipase superfamily enzyme
MSDDFVISVRDVRAGKFVAEPGVTRFLLVPAGQDPDPAQATKNKEEKRQWVAAVLKAALGSSEDGRSAGDILVFIHGYHTSPADMIARHRQLSANLKGKGYQGTLVSFDWPSEDLAFNYLEDRTDAKLTALRLVDDCISLFAICQQQDCRTNVHLLAHSMGAYVVREAFDDADDRRRIAEANWMVSQIMLVAADLSSASLAEDDSTSASLFRHCIRLTNYWNPDDAILKLSNVKRAGLAPRAGRVGLPSNAPLKAVSVDCGEYYRQFHPNLLDIKSHSWYFDDLVFCEDVVMTIKGDIGRDRFPTRVGLVGLPNRLTLVKPPA